MKEDILKIFKNTRSHFIGLHDADIEIKSIPMYLTTMNCRPPFISFLFPWKRRKYIISVNHRKNFSKYSVPIDSMNESIITGWFAHELGHVIQYEKMKLGEFIAFPFKYFFNFDFRRNFEIEATAIAREIGFRDECDTVENFLRNDPRVHEKYKKRFKKFYVAD